MEDNMRIKSIFLFFTFCFLLFTFLHAQNYMDQIAYLEGENENDIFGKYITSLDFNGDGYDDIVVSARGWEPEGTYTSVGKLYFYLGDEVFDTEADFTISGNLDSFVRYQVTNLGDLNNDGYEDLGMMRETEEDLLVQILLGNTEQDTIPDFEQSFSKDYYDYLGIRQLGDINNDGYDDAGLVAKGIWLFQINYPVDYFFIYGNENNLTSELFYSYTLDGSGNAFSGVGDVNNDGYSDFCIGYTYIIEEEQRYTNTFYYGGENIDPEPDLILWDLENTNMTLGLPAGDLNADGYDDFAGHLTTTIEYNIRIWFGQEIITQDCDLILNEGSGGGGLDFAFDYGDINNDGYSDLAIGGPGYGLNGKAFLYLGNENPNNTVDLEFEQPPGVHHDYGTALTVGRFNGDEYDDVAISGPMDTATGPNHGYVYVFAGNGDFDDLVDAEDEEIIPVAGVEFEAYPNPFNPSVTFSVKFSNEQNQQYEQIQIEIFNVKGQKVKTLDLESASPSTFFADGHGYSITWNAEGHTSGVYFCKLINVKDGKVLSVKKVTLMK